MSEDIKTRELSMAELFNFAGELFKKHVKTIIGVWLTILSITFAVIMGTVIMGTAITFAMPQLMGVTIFLAGGMLLVVLALIGVAVPMTVNNLAVRSLEGEEVSLNKVIPTLPILFKGAATTLLYGLIISVLALPVLLTLMTTLVNPTVTVVAGLVSAVLVINVAVRFAFVLQVVAHEAIWGVKALKRSNELVKGKWLKTFAFLIFIVLFAAIPPLLDSTLGASFGGGTMVDVLSFAIVSILSAMISYFTILATSVWYLNRTHTIKKVDEAR